MGKQSEKKKKKNTGSKTRDSNANQTKRGESSAKKAYDKDTAVFISVAQELKEDGNKLFQKRDHEGAMLIYEKALNLLPSNHIDVSYLHTNIAACYMQCGLHEYPRAIHECNLALEITPNYTKALLKRARCYEGLNRLELALRDGNKVLKIDPMNLMATEIVERIQMRIEKNDNMKDDEGISLIPIPDYFDPPLVSESFEEKVQKKKKNKKRNEKKDIVGSEEKKVEGKNEEKKVEGKNEEKKIEGKNEEKKIEGKYEEKNIEGKYEEKKIEGKNEEKKAQVPTKEMKSRKKIEEKKVKGENAEKKSEIMTEEQIEDKKVDDECNEKMCDEQIKEKKMEEKKAVDKLVVKEKISNITEEGCTKTVKLVLGEDIRWAKIPINCNILELREIIHDRFPNLKALLIKYRDQEGDLVTITNNEELRWAESLAGQHGSIRLYIVEVNPAQDPFYGKDKRVEVEVKMKSLGIENLVTENGKGGNFQETEEGPSCIDDWILQFAQLFLNNVGFSSDGYLDIHELGMKLYTEAMEETVTSEEAQELFKTAADKFQEMAALALFNWGNVHMSRARKRVYFKEDSSKESVLEQIKIAYDWALIEYSEAGQRYEEALKIKSDFYEAIVALGQQQFEQAKLSWYYAVATNFDLDSSASAEVIKLYNSAEDNMEKGMQMWELVEEERLNEISRPNKVTEFLEKMDLGRLIKDLSDDEAAEQTANMRSQINVLWGTMLYERSMMEYKLGLPIWQECLEVAVEKFELAGASPTDIAVMIKNHCSNSTSLQGLGFNIDEIVQAWSEMYEAKRWQRSVPSFRLEPLLRRRVSSLYHALEHA